MNSKLKIGLDIDGVLCDFMGGFYEFFGEIYVPVDDFNDPFVWKNFSKIEHNKEFWKNLKPLINPKDVQFDVFCYITARPIPSHLTYLWLVNNEFPSAPVFSTRLDIQNASCKLETIIDLELDYFLDDNLEIASKIQIGSHTKSYLLNASYNQNETFENRVASVKDFSSIITN